MLAWSLLTPKPGPHRSVKPEAPKGRVEMPSRIVWKEDAVDPFVEAGPLVITQGDMLRDMQKRVKLNPLWRVRDFGERVSSGAIASDGKYIAIIIPPSEKLDKKASAEIKMYRVADGKEVMSAVVEEWPTYGRMAFSEDGKELSVWSLSTRYVLDAASGKLLWTQKVRHLDEERAARSRDGKLAATWPDKASRIVITRGKYEIAAFRPRKSWGYGGLEVRWMAFDRDEKHLLVMSTRLKGDEFLELLPDPVDAAITAYDVRTGDVCWSQAFPSHEWLEDACLDPDGRLLALTCDSKKLSLWHLPYRGEKQK
jgi:WD40 repeat protein